MAVLCWWSDLSFSRIVTDFLEGLLVFNQSQEDNNRSVMLLVFWAAGALHCWIQRVISLTERLG